MISIKLNRKSPGGLKGFSKRLEALAGKEVAVGFPRGESVLGNPHYKNGASILLVAVALAYVSSLGAALFSMISGYCIIPTSPSPPAPRPCAPCPRWSSVWTSRRCSAS